MSLLRISAMNDSHKHVSSTYNTKVSTPLHQVREKQCQDVSSSSPILDVTPTKHDTASQAVAHSGKDSGYVSQTVTPGTTASKLYSAVSFRSTLKEKILAKQGEAPKYYEYNKPTSAPFISRFSDLCELLYPPLFRILKHDASKCRLLSIKLKVIGRDKASAKPCIVVLCAPQDCKKIHKFLSQPHIKAQYQSRDCDLKLPSFHLIVSDKAPELAADYRGVQAWTRTLPIPNLDLDNIADSDIDIPPSVIIADATTGLTDSALLDVYAENLPTSTSLSGRKIGVRRGVSWQYARIGGPVLVTHSDGSQSLYGMTVGHVFDSYRVGDTSVASSSDACENSGDSDSDPGPDATCQSAGFCFILDDDLDQEFELDHFPERMRPPASSEMPKISATESIPSSVTSWSKIGRGPIKLAKLREGCPDLDFALIELDSPSKLRTSALPQVSHAKPIYAGEDSQYGRSVRVVTTGSGLDYATGTLTPSTSFLGMGTNEKLVETFLLSLDENSVIDLGDCGAWVIDSKTNVAWGHVVATDNFGDVYVIPLTATIAQMRERIGAYNVTLPTDMEFDRLCCDSHDVQIASSDDSNGSLLDLLESELVTSQLSRELQHHAVESGLKQDGEDTAWAFQERSPSPSSILVNCGDDSWHSLADSTEFLSSHSPPGQLMHLENRRISYHQEQVPRWLSNSAAHYPLSTFWHRSEPFRRAQSLPLNLSGLYPLELFSVEDLRRIDGQSDPERSIL